MKKLRSGRNLKPASDLAEAALQIVARNAPLDENMIKSLRLVCKSTRIAATGRVRVFKLADKSDQNPDHLRASGLLNQVETLEIELDLRVSGDEAQFSVNWSRAVDLLHLVTDVCSKSAKILEVKLQASPEILLASGCLLGKSTWDPLQELRMVENFPMPGFLSGFLARPGSFPALTKISCEDANAVDIQALLTSRTAEILIDFAAYWSTVAYESNTAPAMVTAMRNLLQKATRLENLFLGSFTFGFFDSEQLISLRKLELLCRPLENAILPSMSPALARPWPKLENFSIHCAYLEEIDIQRIFENQDTLPALTQLTFEDCRFEVDALQSITRPLLKNFGFLKCWDGNAFILKIAELIKGGTCILPELNMFFTNSHEDDEHTLGVTALTDLLSCPAMKTLTVLSIVNAQLAENDTSLVRCIADHCPKLVELHLSSNKLGRSAIALLHGYGIMGVWPNLRKLGILEQKLDSDDPNKIDGEHPYLPKLKVQEILRRAWPGLVLW